MKCTVAPGPYPFYLPPSRKPFDPVTALADLAEHNGLNASAFVGREEDHWVEMLEAVSIDPDMLNSDLAEMADARRAAKLRHLIESLEDQNKENEPAVEAPPCVVDPSKQSQNIFGHVPTAVIRWMGAEGWTTTQAVAVLESLDIDVAIGTIRAQLRGGVTGKRGAIPELTDNQVDTLYGLLPD